MAKYDDMSFGKAFAAARKEMGAGKTFTWKGKTYTTNTKEEVKPAGSNRPKPRPKNPLTVEPVTTTRLGPTGGRGDGGAERIRRAADAAITRAEKPVPRASTGGPARQPRKPAAKTETPADRMERARQEAAERRANTRRQAGIGATPAKPAKPAAKPAGRNVLQNIGEFLRGGGYAGYKARQNKKDK